MQAKWCRNNRTKATQHAKRRTAGIAYRPSVLFEPIIHLGIVSTSSGGAANHFTSVGVRCFVLFYHFSSTFLFGSRNMYRDPFGFTRERLLLTAVFIGFLQRFIYRSIIYGII